MSDAGDDRFHKEIWNHTGESCMQEDGNELERLRAEIVRLGARIAEWERQPVERSDHDEWQRRLCDTANEGLWAIDADARTVYANETMARMLGTTVDELFRSSVFDFVDDHGAALARENIVRRQRGVSEEHDFEFVRRDGSRFCASIRTAPISGADGAYRGAAAFITDVTEVRRAERELRQQREDFRVIFDSAPAMIWFKDCENRIVRANKLAAAHRGRTVAEVEGHSAYELFPNQAAAYHADDLEVIRGNRPKLGIVEPILGADGEIRWLRTDKVPCHNEAGKTIGVVVFAVDITDAKRAENALEASERNYRDLVETSHELIWAVDAAGCWTFLNRGATLRIFGREPEEMLTHHFTESQSPEQSAKDMAVFEQILVGQSFFEYETVHLRKDGSPVHLSFNAIVRRDGDGNVLGTTGTATDITERRRVDAEREQINAKLVQTQKLESIGVLAGGIAHDFNNLLVGILGNARLALSQLPADSDARSMIEGVRDASQRAAELVRQLLAYSGRGKFVVETIDMGALAEELGSLLSAAISKNAVLSIDVASELPLIEGDATQIRQVLMNLIMNASDAIGDGHGRIMVTTGVMQASASYLASTYLHDELAPGPYVFVEVKDDGTGMDSSTMAKMFEPFFTTKFAGRGLGLSAVLGILRGHRGAMQVESEQGNGTMIRVLFPAVSARPSMMPEGAGKESRPELQALSGGVDRSEETILVVDDEAMVRNVMQRMLEHAGFRVVSAESGVAAVALFRAQRHRLTAVLLDMTMPTMSGLETYEELRRIDADVRVVLMSGYSEEEAMRRFRGGTLAGFAHKPCSAEQLAAAMRRAIDR